MRLKLVYAFIFLFFVVILSRVYYLSIKSNLYYEELAKQNSVKTYMIAPVRGMIYDTRGDLLAINELGFSISIKPYLHIRKKNRPILDDEIFSILQFFPDLNASEIKKTYQREDSYYNQDYIQVVDFISYDDMIKHYSNLNLRKNLKVEPQVKRKYPYNEVASHVIGYIGKANTQDISENPISKLTGHIGKSGIERYYNDVLQGEQGHREVRINALNKEIEELSFKSAYSNDLNLSIDIRLQQYLSEIFSDNAGVAIVVDVDDGSILAAGSFPEYNLNSFVEGISVAEWKELSNNPDHPFTNKMINGLYPPGSVVKMGVALSFLKSGLMGAASQITCEGFVELGGRNFRCWNRSGHGHMDLKHALQQSCDVYFYEGGLRVGIDRIAPVLSNLGFGSKTGVDLPSEFIGTVPSREWKMLRYKREWSAGETLNTSIGQGAFLVTPMQIARYTAQIATGKNVRLHFFKNNLDFNKSVEDDEIFNEFDKSFLPYIREGMYAVMNEPGGTAYRYFNNFPIQVAGKTGTAQVINFSQAEKKNIRESDLEYYSRSHTWITSYAPYKKPKYVVTVLLEHGGRSTTSAKVTADIYRKMMELGYIK
ncbi:penicillin-binding protein 2 [uncultured Campylobacter sp.]|uniref:penicillin-binding protein 2 n=1 Tax=uncultured Campylobacter sp. TaxID=218934 RepID=UPI00260275D3|nr:penicillin-binding protein 2 [uncultured Campylobacter sp.]